MKITKCNCVNDKIIDDIADVHIWAFSGFFLTFMGKGFLRAMYKSYCEHPNSGLLLATEEDCLVGFLAYSADMSGLYKYMIKKRLPLFAWYSCSALCKKPVIFMRLLRAFLRPSEAKREESYVELASICVRPEIKSKGVGTALINELKSIVDFDNYSYIKLETDAKDNDAVNAFYVKNGFVLDNVYKTPEGREMNEYRCYGKYKN